MHRELKMRCAWCDADVFMRDDLPSRTCLHDAAPVIADMEAVAHGIAALRQQAEEAADAVGS